MGYRGRARHQQAADECANAGRGEYVTGVTVAGRTSEDGGKAPNARLSLLFVFRRKTKAWNRW